MLAKLREQSARQGPREDCISLDTSEPRPVAHARPVPSAGFSLPTESLDLEGSDGQISSSETSRTRAMAARSATVGSAYPFSSFQSRVG
jgi:hypothetical protein